MDKQSHVPQQDHPLLGSRAPGSRENSQKSKKIVHLSLWRKSLQTRMSTPRKTILWVGCRLNLSILMRTPKGAHSPAETDCAESNAFCCNSAWRSQLSRYWRRRMSLLCRADKMAAMILVNTWEAIERPKHSTLNWSARPLYLSRRYRQLRGCIGTCK